MSDCPCLECGCLGNETCGAKSVTGDCSLDDNLVCACCAKLGKEANMARWPENKVLPDAEQMELNLTN